MTFSRQNKSVVICELTKDVFTSFLSHWTFVGHSKLSTGSLATRLSKCSPPEKLKFLTKLVKDTVSEAMLEEKLNCTKLKNFQQKNH